MAVETYHALGKILKGKYGVSATNVGYEGGYAPPLVKTRDALDAIMGALDISGYGKEIKIGLDSAASSFYLDGGYSVDGNRLTPGELIDYYVDLVKTYPIILLEDPFEEEAYDDFAGLTAKLPGTIISRRRHLCDQHKAPGEGHQDACRQRPAAQTQPDRIRLRGL